MGTHAENIAGKYHQLALEYLAEELQNLDTIVKALEEKVKILESRNNSQKMIKAVDN